MPQTDDYNLRPLSRHQYGTLKFIHDNKVTMAYLRHAHANTLGSIAQRGYLQKSGQGDDAEIFLTKAGVEALRLYMTASLNERTHEGELTERCLRLLKHTRGRVVHMEKAS